MRAPLAPPRLSVPRNVDADAHAVETSSETDNPDAEDLALESCNVLLVDQFMIDGRERGPATIAARELPGRNASHGPMSR
jgi:hypothetical protein